MVEILADFFVLVVLFGLTKSAYPLCQTEGTVSNFAFETVPCFYFVARAFFSFFSADFFTQKL